MNDSDSLYHRLFRHPLMVEHLLSLFLAAELAALVDFRRMRLVPVTFHAGSATRREADIVWCLPLLGGG